MTNRPILAAFLSIEGTSLSDAEKRLLARYNPLGITLFNRNLENAEQVKNLVAEIKELVRGDETLIALDSEGGRVNRLKAAGFPDYAFQQTLAETSDSEKIVKMHAALISRDMRAVGANLNFAPVLDVAHQGMTAALEGRVFSSDAQTVARLGNEMIKTYISEGICPCMKHLPGHGRAMTDPHLSLPVINEPLEALEPDFEPFHACRDCPAGMTAHILINAVDPKHPVTQSEKGIRELIRGRIGFEGFLISDAIDMKALHGNVVEKALGCWQAGCDAVCYCIANIKEMEALCANGQYLSDKSLTRLARILETTRHKKTNMLDFNEKDYYSATQQVKQISVAYDATETLHQMQKGEM